MASSSAALRCPHSFSAPVFLAPAFTNFALTTSTSATRSFSTTSSRATRRTTGSNKNRGVSAIRSKPGKWRSTEVYKWDLPQPVIDPERRALFKTKDDHGLWGFFNDKKEPMIPGPAEGAHGRAWTFMELSNKNFDDLHKLYWTCIREQNRIATRMTEMKRTSAGYGTREAEARKKAVQQTMREIRHVLQVRNTNWNEAKSLLNEKYLVELLPSEEDPTEDYGLEELPNQSTVEYREQGRR